MKKHQLKIVGKVIHGQENGRKLGFPTANLNFSGKLEAGVYAGNVDFEGRKYQAGIIYFPEKHLLEAHILSFSGNLYDKEIEVEIGEKIREIIKFKNNEELINQVKRDIEIIRKK